MWCVFSVKIGVQEIWTGAFCKGEEDEDGQQGQGLKTVDYFHHQWAKQGRGQPPFFFPLSDFSNGCTIFNSCKKASQSMSREAVGRWCQQGTLRTGGAGPTCVWLSKAFSCHPAGCTNPARARLLLAWGLLAGDSLALTSCQDPPQKGTQKLVSEHQASFGCQC